GLVKTSDLAVSNLERVRGRTRRFLGTTYGTFTLVISPAKGALKWLAMRLTITPYGLVKTTPGRSLSLGNSGQKFPTTGPTIGGSGSTTSPAKRRTTPSRTCSVTAIIVCGLVKTRGWAFIFNLGHTYQTINLMIGTFPLATSLATVVFTSSATCAKTVRCGLDVTWENFTSR